MLFGFFFTLRTAGLKPSLSEFLMLLDALSQRVAIFSMEDFYALARSAMVKDESQYDRYDRAFAAYFKGVEMVFPISPQPSHRNGCGVRPRNC